MAAKPIAFKKLRRELASLRSLDQKNQKQYGGANRAGKAKLTSAQLYLLTEAIFFAAFRAYEQFLRNVFLLYCCGIKHHKSRIVRSYLQPKNLNHAETLIRSSMPFLDWSRPDTLLERSETYLKNGFPLKTPLAANIEELRDLRRLRNHIAHMSVESLQEYKKILKKHYGTIPLRVPRPGEFLLMPSKKPKTSYYLHEYLGTIESVAKAMTLGGNN